MKKLSLLLLLIAFSFQYMCAGRQGDWEYPDFCEDGIYYVTIGESVYVYSDKMFYPNSPREPTESPGNCYSGHVVIPEQVTHDGVTYKVEGISGNAMENCPDILSISIPPTVKYIGEHAFFGCQNLNAVYITDLDAWLSIDFAIYSDMGEFYDGSLSCNPLFYAHNLYLNGEKVTTAEFPEGLETIRPALTGCTHIKKITIPSTTKYINYGAFSGCSNLKSIITHAPSPPQPYGFGYGFVFCDNYDISLLVPIGCLKSYTRKDYNLWQYFKYIGEGVEAQSLSFSSHPVQLQVGETYTCGVEILPENAAFKTPIWTSSNPEVISIDENGLAKAHTPGDAWIKAVTVDGTELADSAHVVVVNSQYSIALADAAGITGDTVSVALSVENQMEIAGIQMTVNLPEGFITAFKDSKPVVELNGTRCDDHTVSTKRIDNTTYNVIVFSPSAEPFKGNSGEICTLRILILDETQEGNYPVTISNIIVSEPNGTRHQYDNVSSTISASSIRYGDANGDKIVNMEDVDATAQYITGHYFDLKEGQYFEPIFLVKNADVNSDKDINVADVALVTNIVKGNEIKWNNLFSDNTENSLVSLEDLYCLIGDTITVTCQLNNFQNLTGLQTRINIPDGFSMVEGSLTLNKDRITDHILSQSVPFKYVDVLVYSPSLDKLKGETGDIFSFKLLAKPQAGNSTHELTFSKNTFTDADGVLYNGEPSTISITSSTSMPGDANNDHKVDVADVLLTANMAIGNILPNFVFDAGDINHDKRIDVADVILVANIAVGKDITASMAPRMGDYSDTMSIEDLTINAGEEKTVSVMLDNTATLSALQMNVNLPYGLELKKVSLTGRASSDHAVLTHSNEDGSVNLMAFSASADDFNGNNGAVLTFTIKATEDFNGNGTILLNDILIADSNANTRSLDNVAAHVTSSATGITDLDTTPGIVNVYNTTGQLVRRDVDASNATTNLPAGIYIIGGKKVLVK